MTLNDCTCKAQSINQQLSTLYKSSAYVISCDQGNNTVLCINFTCPCYSRRLLATSETTSISYVYKNTAIVNDTALSQNLEVAINKSIQVVLRETQILETNILAWDSAALFITRPTASVTQDTNWILLVLILLAMVVVIAGVSTAVYFCCFAVPPAPPLPPSKPQEIRVPIRWSITDQTGRRRARDTLPASH